MSARAPPLLCPNMSAYDSRRMKVGMPAGCVVILIAAIILALWAISRLFSS